jgi:hypothetical protein
VVDNAVEEVSENEKNNIGMVVSLAIKSKWTEEAIIEWCHHKQDAVRIVVVVLISLFFHFILLKKVLRGNSVVMMEPLEKVCWMIHLIAFFRSPISHVLFVFAVHSLGLTIIWSECVCIDFPLFINFVTWKEFFNKGQFFYVLINDYNFCVFFFLCSHSILLALLTSI